MTFTNRRVRGWGRGIWGTEGFRGAPHLNLPWAPLFLDPPLGGCSLSLLFHNVRSARGGGLELLEGEMRRWGVGCGGTGGDMARCGE